MEKKECVSFGWKQDVNSPVLKSLTFIDVALLPLP